MLPPHPARSGALALGALALGALALAGCAGRIVPATTAPAAPLADVVASVILVGDGGAPKASGEPVLAAVRSVLASRPDSTVILFLGDNVYPAGLPDSGDRAFPEAARRLRAQLDLAADAPLIFVPGNHDWDRSGREGWDRIRRAGRFIARERPGRARLLPADGCPGPEVVDVGATVRLLLLDTEWWLFKHEKPGEGSDCGTRSRAEVVAGLRQALRESRGRQVIVAGHHPLLSGGPHGGYFSLADHLFPLRNLHPALWVPLPIIGTAYPAIRGLGISAEDLGSGPYRALRAALDSAFACDPPALYAAGHEHTLQLIDRGRPPLLAVSGAGILGHESHVQGIPGTRLALGTAGFMRADALRDGRVRLAVITVSHAGEPREVYAEMLAPAGTAGRCGPD